MIFLIIITSLLLIISFIKNRQKTVAGLKKAAKKLGIILPILLAVLIIVSVVLYFIPGSRISEFLAGNNAVVGYLAALLIGAITMIPGFIAFPLSGILRQNGVSFMIISVFTTTLMMVGFLTFPVEKKYFGMKVAVLRNVISLFIAVTVSLVTGILFREIL